MKSLLVFCILFVVSISAEDCNFENEPLKAVHSEYLQKANEWDFAKLIAELKNLNAKFVEWRDSLDPKCFEGAKGAKSRHWFDMFTNKFEFLGTITEEQKKTIYAPKYFECLGKHANDIRTCVKQENALRLLDTCDDEAEKIFLNCEKTMVKDQCHFPDFQDYVDFGKYMFKYSKEKNLCGKNHIYIALMETALW